MPEEATTPDPVQLLRRAIAAANRHDLDAVISFYAPDAVFEARGVGGPFEGRAAFRRFLDEWFGAYEELELKLEDVRDLGSGVVFAVVVQEGVPAGSAVHGRVWQREGWVFVWERGLIARHTTDDIDEARAAAERLAESREQAVSHENVEIVRELTELWNSGIRDFARIPEWADPAIEVQGPLASVDGEAYHGHAGIERWVGDVEDQFAEWTFSPDQIREVGDAVIATGTLTTRGRESGVALQSTLALIYYFGGDHRVTRWHIYLDVKQALEAVGLA